jgi:hypothetical protein
MSKTEPVLEEKYKGYIVKVLIDDFGGDSPRDWDNLGHMVCFHRRDNYGDKHDFSTPADLYEFFKEHRVVRLPIYMYDHSGVALSTGRSYPFNDPWDAGQLGYIYATYEEIRKDYGVKHVTQSITLKVEKVLKSEVETYSRYLNGEVYGWMVSTLAEPDEQLDSVWGYFDDTDFVLQEGKDHVDWLIKDAAKRAELAKLEVCS